METTIDKFGRIIIPKTLRDSLNLMPGEQMDIEIYNDGFFLKPLLKESIIVNEDDILILDGTVSETTNHEDIVRKIRLERLSGFLP